MPELDLSQLDLAPSDEQLKTVSRIADQQLALERDLEQLDAEYRTKKNLHVQVSQQDLPDAMAAMGLSSFTLENGASIEIKKGVDANITEVNRPPAYDWLRSNGHGAIIKHEFKVPFGPGEDKKALALSEHLKGIDHDFSSSTTIHAMTLRAWARTQLEEGNDIPESITAYEYSVAKITTP